MYFHEVDGVHDSVKNRSNELLVRRPDDMDQVEGNMNVLTQTTSSADEIASSPLGDERMEVSGESEPVTCNNYDEDTNPEAALSENTSENYTATGNDGEQELLESAILEVDLDNMDLETLKTEHKKLLEMIRNSRDETKQGSDNNEASQDETEESDDTPGSVTYVKGSSGGAHAGDLSDETFLTGAFLGKTEQPIPPAPSSDDKKCTGTTTAPSVSPTPNNSQSPVSSESESLITVKEVPACKVAGNSDSPVSLTSSGESFTTTSSEFNTNKKSVQNTSAVGDTSIESFSTADNEVLIEKVEYPHPHHDVIMGKGLALEVKYPGAESTGNPEHQSSATEKFEDSAVESPEVVPGLAETSDVSDYDVPSNDSSRLSAYGIHLDTSSESNQEGNSTAYGMVPPVSKTIQGSVDFYDSPVFEDTISKQEAPQRHQIKHDVYSELSEVLPDERNQLRPAGLVSETQKEDVEQEIERLKEKIHQEGDLDGNFSETSESPKSVFVKEPVPVATSSPAKTKQSSANKPTYRNDDGDMVFRSENPYAAGCSIKGGKRNNRPKRERFN